MKPNKLKRNLILIFSIVIILFATIFVLYMTTDIFRTKRDAFFRYAMQIPDIFDVLDTNSDYQTYQKTKQTNTYLTTGEMKITSSENIADESILSKVNMIVLGKTDNKKEQANYDISIRSDNNNILIGKDGKTLNAIQLILRQSFKELNQFDLRIIVDVSNYKAKKIKNLEYEVKKICKEVLKTKVEVKLDPMNSYERRKVHSVVAEFEGLQSISYGESPNRYTVIKIKD